MLGPILKNFLGRNLFLMVSSFLCSDRRESGGLEREGRGEEATRAEGLIV